MSKEKVYSSLHHLESQLYNATVQDKASRLFAWISSTDLFKSIESWTTSANLWEVNSYFTRVCQAFSFFFLDKNAPLNSVDYQKLRAYYVRIHYYYYLSGLKDSSSISRVILERSSESIEGKIHFTNKSEAHKYLLLVSPLSAEDSRVFHQLASKSVEAIFTQLILFLTLRITSLKEVEKNKKLISDLFFAQTQKIPKNFPLSNMHLLWGSSSYMDSEVNNQVKSGLARMLNNSLESTLGTLEPIHKNFLIKPSEKPVLVILAENLYREHVMYRCFGVPLSHLRKHFKLIAVTAEEDRGNKEWDWVDELVTFKLSGFSINLMVERVQKLQPDVILYPSIGMKMWTIILSRLRLAPLQISLLGHPDLPYSDDIDFVIGGRSLLEKVTGPTVIALKNTPGSLFNFSTDRRFPEFEIREKPDVLKVAVCANIFKLTPDFVGVLKSINSSVNRTIEFHVMQNLTGIHYQIGQKQIKEELGYEKSFVYPAQSRIDYYKILGSCDLYLSPFPFGGENSTLDALLMGLPTVCLKGTEPRERLDYRVLKTLNLESELSTLNQEGYIQKALELIHSDEKRMQLSQLIRDKNVRETFLKESEECATELADTIHSIYLTNVK